MFVILILRLNKQFHHQRDIYRLFILPYRVWSSIVFVHEKCSFFRNVSKTAETILIKKIGRNHGISIYKKTLISENRKKIIFFEIITVLSKCLLVCKLVSLYVTNCCGRSSSKTSVNIKTEFHTYFLVH